jgi:predicted nucleic acid-binding protein
VSSPPVVNASPLIYLAHADLIDLLQAEGSSIFVPRTVSEEIQRRGFQDPTAQVLKTTAWLREVDPVSPSPRVLTWRLGPGETSVLSWSLAHPGSVAIVDDLAARRCAEVLGIPLLGTLGVVLKAKRKGLLPAARPAIEKLLAAGMYLSPKILDRALALVGE